MRRVQRTRPDIIVSATDRPPRTCVEVQDSSVARCPRCHEAWSPPLPAYSVRKQLPATSAYEYALATEQFFVQRRQYEEQADEAFAQWKEKHRHCLPNLSRAKSNKRKSSPLLDDSAQGHCRSKHSTSSQPDFDGHLRLPSDSGYQSGIGTDTDSVISDVSTGSSLGVSRDLIHDFVAFFGDTLIGKAGAQQWAQFAMAHHPQSEIEKRLTALLRAFAIDLAARRSTSMVLDDGKVHPVHDDESVRVLLDGAIKLVRRYRHMIARYFLENSISGKAEAVSLSDRLQGLGRHFSLAERVDLLVHRGVREIDEGDKGDEDEDDNVVDEDIVPQLEPVQDMLVSGDAFRHLASELRRSLYRDDSYGMTTIRDVILKSVTSSNTSTACWATATFLAKWDVMRFMRSQYNKLPSVASVLVLTGSALYAQAITCGEYVRMHWPTTGFIFLDLLDKVLVSDANKTATIDLGMSTPYRQQSRP
jgi:hypothetical protein